MSNLQPWQFYMTASLVAAAAAVWLSPPASPVALLFISLAIAAAGASAAALHHLLLALTGERRLEPAVTGRERAALEREKLLALRAIKDLEFDRAMGKVSPDDAGPLELRLRDRAAAIMRELDGRDAVRAEVEREVAARRATSRPAVRAAGLCVCGIANDTDARFCKQCGAKL